MMKRIISLLIVFVAFSANCYAQDVVRVLAIGNSFSDALAAQKAAHAAILRPNKITRIR